MSELSCMQPGMNKHIIFCSKPMLKNQNITQAEPSSTHETYAFGQNSHFHGLSLVEKQQDFIIISLKM